MGIRYCIDAIWESPKPEQSLLFFSFYSLAVTSLLGAPVLSHVLANRPGFFLLRGSPYLARYALSGRRAWSDADWKTYMNNDPPPSMSVLFFLFLLALLSRQQVER